MVNAQKYFQEHPEFNSYGLNRLDVSALTLHEQVNGLGEYRLTLACDLSVIFQKGGHDFYVKAKKFLEVAFH